ncbi:hypothetical protein Cni_G03926 [Canna indica]|uniref:Uncharacterized protein n=1 Tax=Canna indica TaxID=4628 RepID=A0AAQ3JUI5_9LILI|nr:hypothetical protein Cni_G03926 [Canna indica]
MRPTSSLTTPDCNLWHTPIPYLFGGLGAMMVLIAVALVILACSHWKSSDDDQSSAAPSMAVLPFNMDYQRVVVVIMAGESKPTFMAKPLPSSVEDKNKASSICHEP